MRLMLIRLFFALCLIGGFANAAQATCKTSNSALTFTPGSSYAVKSGTVASVSGLAGLSCTGSVLTLLGGNTAQATVTSASGNFTMSGSNGGSIPYQLAADQNFTVPFTQGGSADYQSLSLLTLDLLGSGNTLNPPIYAKLTGSPNIPAGTYTDTITVQWNYKVCNGLNVAGLLCAGYDSGTATNTITVTLVVSADCKINAPNVSFGTAALASQFSQVSQAVLVDCTAGSSYKVSFSSGSNGSSRPWRAMSDGAGHTLQYNIYRSDGTTIWDESNPLASTVNGGKGTGADTPAQMQSYIAKVNAAQVTPPAGSYADTVNVIISF